MDLLGPIGKFAGEVVRSQTLAEMGRAAKVMAQRMRPIRYVLEGFGVADETGQTGGKFLYPMIRDADILAHNNLTQMQKDIGGLLRGVRQTPEVKSAMCDYIQGQVPATKLNAQEIRLSDYISQKFDHYGQMDEQLGFAGRRRGNYMTHIREKYLGGLRDPEEVALSVSSPTDLEAKPPFFVYSLPRDERGPYLRDPVLALLKYYAPAAERRIQYKPVVDFYNENLRKHSAFDLDLREYAAEVLRWITHPKGEMSTLEKAIDPLARKATRLIYSGAIGSLGSALTNLLQLPMASLPELGPKYLLKGASELGNTALKRKMVDMGIFKDVIPQEVWELTEPSLFLKRTSKMTEVVTFPFQQAEFLNRMVTFGGAYHKALDKGKGLIKELPRSLTSDAAHAIKGFLNAGEYEKAALEYAREVTGKTQYFYGIVDTPLILKHPLARMFFMFYSFPINTIEMLARNVYVNRLTPQIVKTLGGKEKTIMTGKRQWSGDWAKALTYTLASYMLFAAGRGLGLDMASKVGLGVLPQGFSPIVQTFYHLGGLANNWFRNNEMGIDNNLNKLRQLLPLWVPGGRFFNKLKIFIERALDRDRNGNLIIRDRKTKRPIATSSFYGELMRVFDLPPYKAQEMVKHYYRKRYPGFVKPNKGEQLWDVIDPVNLYEGLVEER